MRGIFDDPLDPLQRYVRLDESEDSEVVPVADGVTFLLLLQMLVTNILLHV